MGATPDQLKERIDRTRDELSADVTELADRVVPTRVVHRKATAMRGRVTDLRDRVMGSASGLVEEAQYAGVAVSGTITSTARDTKEAVMGTAQQVPERTLARTQGSPLGAGLLAFGAGMVLASLLPETKAEAQAGQALREHASDVTEPLTGVAKEVAEGVKGAVVPAAREAATAVKETATQAVEQTTQEAKDAAQQVKS